MGASSPTMSRRIVLPLVVCAVLATLAWWWFAEHAATQPASSVAPSNATPATSVPAVVPVTRAQDPETPVDRTPTTNATATGTATLSGFVRDDAGVPIESFRIHMRPVRAAESTLDARSSIERDFTSSTGAYEVDHLAPGVWTVSAERVISSQETEVEVVREAKLDLVIDRLVRATGTVVDPFGRGVAHAKVCVRSRSAAGEAARASALTFDAGERGEFDIANLPPGTLSFVGSAPGWVAGPAAELDYPPGGSTGSLNVTVVAAGHILGRAFDSKGAPDAGREVRVAGESTCGSTFPRATTTDDSGMFEFGDLARGRYELTRVERPGEANARGASPDTDRESALLRAPKSVDVDTGQTVEVVLGGPPDAGYRVWGVVSGIERSGGPWYVTFAPAAGHDTTHQRFAPVDEHSRYELVLETSGSYVATVAARPGVLLTQSVELVGIPVQQIDFVVGTASISGRVVGVDGAAFAGAEIDLATASATGIQPSMRHAYSGEQGEFAFAALPAATYGLSARAPFSPGKALDIAPARIDDIAVERGARIEGLELKLTRGGSIAIENVSPDGISNGSWAELADAHTKTPFSFQSMSIDPAGAIRVRGLAPGAWFVRSFRSPFMSAWTGPFEIKSGEETRAKVELVATAVLDIDVDGLREPGATVVAKDARGFELARSFARALTMRARPIRVTLGPFPLGRIQVIVSDTHGRSKTLDLEITSPRPPAAAVDLGN